MKIESRAIVLLLSCVFMCTHVHMKIESSLVKCMNNLSLDNDSYNELSEEFNGYEVEKYKIKTELYKFKNKFENKNLLKYKAKMNLSSRTMKKIIIENEVHETDNEIREALTGHFTSVFSCYCEENADRCSRCTRDDFEFIKNINPQKDSNKRLSNEMKSKLEKDVDDEEVEKYVKRKLRKEGKAPGPDGIPYAFIYKFWPSIKKLVTEIVKYTLNENLMPKNMAEGLVIFLPTPGKDQEKINGWRPLTMLNSIYKICSGILASRIDDKIDQLIHKHQYGFVKKRQAADVIELINIMMRENNEKTLAIVGMDFRGAFYTVKHEAIIRALKRKNFGPKFILMVATLLMKNESTVSVNGRINNDLEKVLVKRSARQGDPLSPFLFILVLDELLELIDKNEDINGVEINEELIKGFAFADDNYTAFTNEAGKSITQQVKSLMKVMKKFKKISGLDINVSKSEVLTNDELFKTNEITIEGIEIKTSIKALGVKVGRDVDLAEEIKLKINKSVEAWNKMKLNFVEKIDVVNFIIIPKVVHILRHCKIEEGTCKVLRKTLKNYVFNGCNKAGKDEVIHSKIVNGGWGLRCIEVVWTQLLLRWTLRALKMENTSTLKNLRDYTETRRGLDTRDPESTGHGNPISKKSLYSNDNIWENAFKILEWVVQNVLKKKVCYDHQPLIDNKLVTKPGKVIKKEELPDVDFGLITDVKALRESRIEIFGGRNKINKNLTSKIFLKLTPTSPPNLPECDDDCRPPIRSLMASRKFANDITRCLLFGYKLDTGIKVKASLSTYTNEIMSQPNFENHMKMSNPKGNFLLNDRCALLRMKIRFRIFYTKQDLLRMKIEGINDSICSYCTTHEDQPQNESLRHLLLECKGMGVVWKHFRKEINSKWRMRFSFLEMVNGPYDKNPGKMKCEYVFLRIINRFTGIRNKEGMEFDLREKLIRTCDDAIRVVEKIFDKKLKVSLREV